MLNEFLDENFEKCESMIYDFSESYLDDYYIAKSFILLSDILATYLNPRLREKGSMN